jgi:hypothetical protein
LSTKIFNSVGSRELQIYATHWLVNKTVHNLIVDKDANLALDANKAGIYHKCSETMRLQINFSAGQKSAWSPKIKIGEVGTSKVVTIKTNNPNLPDTIEFGVGIIQGPSPMSMTKIVQIVPRFIIKNNLGFPVHIR